MLGNAALDKAKATMAGLDDAVKAAGRSWKDYALVTAGVTAAAGSVYYAMKQVYDQLRQGAVLQTTIERFDKLANSIGSTSDVLLGRLRDATRGMISDMDLMASASQIMSLGLAKNEDQVVRLANVAGVLGWDMQQVILTFANMSTMRLDALGLSVEDVTSRAKELEAAGMSAADAFKEAVIQAGEARLDVGGVSDAELAFKNAEAAAKNFTDAVSISIVKALEQAGAFDAMKKSAEDLNSFVQFTDELDRLVSTGQLTDSQAQQLTFTIKRAGEEIARAKLETMLMNNTLSDTSGWWVWTLMTRDSIESSKASAAAMAGIIPVATDLMSILPAVYGPAIEQGDIFLYQLDQINNRLAGIDPGIRARGQMRSGMNGLPWLRTGFLEDGWEREYTKGVEKAIGYTGGWSAALSETEAVANRLKSAFSSEISGNPAEGLIDEAGMVNLERANELLYNQAEAAGASAMELAMLGIATGKFSEEQAKAALKAAVLQEAITRMAKAITSGQLGIEDAVAQVGDIKVALDATQDMGGIQAALAGIEADPTSVNVDFIPLSLNVRNEMDDIDGTRLTIYADVRRGTTEGIPGSGMPDRDGDGVPDNADRYPDDPERRQLGGPVRRGKSYLVGEAGPELFVPGMSGFVVSNNNMQARSGNMNVTINVSGSSAEPERVGTAVRDAMTQFWSDLRFEGGSW